jgi:anti-sigma-K factor RskA
MTEPTCSHTDDVAAYALGALPDDEAARLREHLAGCSRCAAELAELQPVVDRLPAAVPAAIASPALKGRVMSVVNSEAELLRAAGPSADRPPAPEPRRRRFALPSLAWAGAVGLAAAAAIVVVVAIGSGGTSVRISHGTTVFHSASVLLRQSGGHAELDVANMPPPPPDRIYQVWLEHGSAPPRPTDALFGVNRSGDASVAVPGDLHGVQHVLVTREPLGGSPNGKPSEAPVMSVTISI